MFRLYDQGKQKIEKELDIVKILTTLRNIKAFNKIMRMNDITKFIVKHSHHNIIDVDSSDYEQSDRSDVTS